MNGARAGAEAANWSALPMPVQQAVRGGAPSSRPGSSRPSPLQFVENQSNNTTRRPASPVIHHRPMELLRRPSYGPPAFDDDDPPPPLPSDIMTPPPNYDIIVGTPSVDGLADYFVRLANYEDMGHADRTPGSDETHVPGGGSGEASDYLTSGGGGGSNETTPPAGDAVIEDDESDSGDENHPTRIHSGGRVNVANPRTPGGRMIPSRSLDLERPVLRLALPPAARRRQEQQQQ